MFKELYRNHGIYWHGRKGFGDETNAWTRTIAEYRAMIDAKIAKWEADHPPTPAYLYWKTLDDKEKRRWRQACQCTELSASELAYTNRQV